MPENVFLTDARRDALENYDPADSGHRGHKSRTTTRARMAFDELLWVAQSPVIDHREVFPPEKVRALLVTLLAGSGGLVHDREPTQQTEAWQPDREDRDAWFTAISRALINVEANADRHEERLEMAGARVDAAADE
jgi:hypothetical protein